MQTFLPYANFEQSAKALDWRRLGKQRVEAMQILSVLLGTNSKKRGWINHPCCNMWRGYEEALKVYLNIMIKEWINRGYNNTMLLEDVDIHKVIFPPWFGKEEFHSSHRAALLFKEPQWYSQFNWSESRKLCYQWWNPIKHEFYIIRCEYAE